MSSSGAKQETGKILSPGETQKLDVPRYLLGERSIQNGDSRDRFPLSAMSYGAVQKAELCLLMDERKEKSQGENCLLFYPGINSGSSGLLTSMQLLAVIFNFTSAGCSLI